MAKRQDRAHTESTIVPLARIQVEFAEEKLGNCVWELSSPNWGSREREREKPTPTREYSREKDERGGIFFAKL